MYHRLNNSVSLQVHTVRGHFHAFAMVCLAYVVNLSRSLNWQRVKAMGLLFRRATARSGDKGVAKSVKTISNIYEQCNGPFICS